MAAGALMFWFCLETLSYCDTDRDEYSAVATLILFDEFGIQEVQFPNFASFSISA